MICGIEWHTQITYTNAYRMCRKFNLEVKRGYNYRKENCIDEEPKTWVRDGEYNHLFIEIRKHDGNYKLSVRGSLHKFFKGDNKGKFSGMEVLSALEGLYDLFEIDPEQTTVENLEVGINLPVWFSVYKYLKGNLLCHKKKYFKEMDKKGIGFVTDKYDDFEIKIYEKNKHLLRFEVKYKSQSKLDSFGVRRLSDLNEANINKLVNSLVNEWNEIVMRGEIDVLDQKSWHLIMTQYERDKLSDFSSIFYKQSYQKKLENADMKGKEQLRKESARLKNYCVKIINDRGDKGHEKIGKQIKEGVQKFITEWSEG